MRSWWDFGESSGHPGNNLSLGLLVCGFCNVRGQFKVINSLHKSIKSSGKILNYETLQCENCGNYTFTFWSSSRFGGYRGLYNYLTLPYPLGEVLAPEYWHKDVQRYWKQAHTSLKTGNWDAAALMTRSALEVVMREKGAKGKNLFQEIEDLHTKGILPQIMKEFANEVRELGNDSAHPDLGANETTQEDAEDIVEFLDILLDYIYNLPKKLTIINIEKVSLKFFYQWLLFHKDKGYGFSHQF